MSTPSLQIDREFDMISTKKHPLRCDCGECRLPFAYVQAGALVIESRHRGEKHKNVVSLQVVKQLLESIN